MPNDPFYRSGAWAALRAQALKRDGYRCIRCGVKAAHVHHEIPRRQRPDLALDLANLVTLCDQCHRRAHDRHGGAVSVASISIKGCDASGRPLDPRHPWNGK